MAIKLKIKKGDTVVIRRGIEAKKRGKVLRVLPLSRGRSRLVVEGANTRKRRERPRQAGRKGQIVDVFHPLPMSAVLLWCTHCGRGVRTGIKINARGDKQRICRRCERVI